MKLKTRERLQFWFKIGAFVLALLILVGYVLSAFLF